MLLGARAVSGDTVLCVHCAWRWSVAHPPTTTVRCRHRLKDVAHADGRLHLVFEWLDKDLKKYMDAAKSGISTPLIKVRRSRW